MLWVDGYISATPVLTVHQVAFKTFLNITPSITFPPPSLPQQSNTTPQLPHPSEFTLTFDENPLSEFAELPRDAKEGGLWFSNVLCGVIRGSLEMVSVYTRLMLHFKGYTKRTKLSLVVDTIAGGDSVLK